MIDDSLLHLWHPSCCSFKYKPCDKSYPISHFREIEDGLQFRHFAHIHCHFCNRYSMTVNYSQFKKGNIITRFYSLLVRIHIKNKSIASSNEYSFQNLWNNLGLYFVCIKTTFLLKKIDFLLKQTCTKFKKGIFFL